MGTDQSLVLIRGRGTFPVRTIAFFLLLVSTKMLIFPILPPHVISDNQFLAVQLFKPHLAISHSPHTLALPYQPFCNSSEAFG